jgi:hypothetical protein
MLKFYKKTNVNTFFGNNYNKTKMGDSMTRILLYIALILPWFSLFFIRKSTIKRFMPVTIFTALLMTIVFQIAYTYDWWVIHEYIAPWGYMVDVSFAYGVFAVGTLWIFILTHHSYVKYLITNMVFDGFFSFFVFDILDKLGIGTIKNLKEWQYFLIMLLVSVIIYIYFRWQDTIWKEDDHE